MTSWRMASAVAIALWGLAPSSGHWPDAALVLCVAVLDVVETIGARSHHLGSPQRSQWVTGL